MAPQEHDHDLELARAIARRDPEASERLLAEHGDAIYHFLRLRVGGDGQVAEDLCQETLLTALHKISAYRGESSLRTWLIGVAKNKVRASLRGRRARLFGDILIAADDEILTALGKVESEVLPQAILEREETRSFVAATLASLPDSYQDALRSRYIDGHSVPETARRQGRGVKAAESTLVRAKRAFRSAFEAIVRSASSGASQSGDAATPGRSSA